MSSLSARKQAELVSRFGANQRSVVYPGDGHCCGLRDRLRGGAGGGTLVVPGGPAVVLFVRELRPPLFLAPTASGVHVCSQSLLTGNPKRIVATLPPMPFPARDGKARINWEDRAIGISAKEYRELVTATTDLRAAADARPVSPPVLPASSWPTPR